MNYDTDKVSADTSTSETTYYTVNATSIALTPISGNTFLQYHKDWAEVVLVDVSAMETIMRKEELIMNVLVMDEDFVWYFKKSEYDGFTMAQPRQGVFLFRSPAMASFYHLKWL